MTGPAERLPMLAFDAMDAQQLAAAQALIAGPRKAVKGPFISLLRSPELLTRVQKLGEFLRFDGSLLPRIVEFATLVVSRRWTQDFEWQIHVPLALKAGTEETTLDQLRQGRRPTTMSADEALVYDFCTELLDNCGVSDLVYKSALDRFGERGLVELVSVIGYFVLMAMLLNVARTPPESKNPKDALPRFPG